MGSTTAENVVFYLRYGFGMFFFAAAIWTLAPLYRYNFAEFRARLKAWTLAIFIMCIGPSHDLANTTLEWLVTSLLEFSTMQRLVQASGVPREYFDVLPSIIMLVVTIYLSVRFVMWSTRVDRQKTEQTEAQRPGNVEFYQDKQHLLPGAPRKYQEEPERETIHHVPSSHPLPN
jgi:hypothetical protein